ncbi:hypothetical protein SAMN02787142_1260 [Burkholderia sp. WP9]|nr:hypothetical protein SAMN02787142_1260 [Burkholderia sp. WP9]
MKRAIITVIAAVGASLFWLFGGRKIDPENLE